MLSSTEHVMVLGGDLDLSSTVDPQLTYWIRGALTYRGGFQAQVSTDGGIGWTTLPNTGIGESTIPEWRRYQVSLDTYRQSGVKIRFRVSQGSTYAGGNIIFLDDVSIEEMPQPVTLGIATPHLKSVDLSWSQSALGDFDRYEVYRSTSANVSVANDLVFSSSTSTDTAFTDTGLSIGATYYYKVFVFNSRQVATPSNERSGHHRAPDLPVQRPHGEPRQLGRHRHMGTRRHLRY